MCFWCKVTMPPHICISIQIHLGLSPAYLGHAGGPSAARITAQGKHTRQKKMTECQMSGAGNCNSAGQGGPGLDHIHEFFLLEMSSQGLQYQWCP